MAQLHSADINQNIEALEKGKMGVPNLQQKSKIKVLIAKQKRPKDSITKKGLPSEAKMKPLASDFVPSDRDVICSGRGKATRNHPGNRLYQETIEHYLPLYAKAKCKLDKSLIVNSVIATIRDASSTSAGFVREEKGRWYEASALVIRERIGASLRDLLHNKYSSSSHSKRKHRKVVQEKLDWEVEQILVRQNCKEIVAKLGRLPSEIDDDDDLQYAFNEANSDLLAALKAGSNESDREIKNCPRETSPSLVESLAKYTSAFQTDDGDGDNAEPIPYTEV